MGNRVNAARIDEVGLTPAIIQVFIAQIGQQVGFAVQTHNDDPNSHTGTVTPPMAPPYDRALTNHDKGNFNTIPGGNNVHQIGIMQHLDNVGAHIGPNGSITAHDDNPSAHRGIGPAPAFAPRSVEEHADAAVGTTDSLGLVAHPLAP